MVGGGAFGSALAAWLALRGTRVVVRELDDDSATAATQRIAGRVYDAARRGVASPIAAGDARNNVRVTTAWTPLEECDLVVEAVPDDPAAKRDALADAERALRPRAVLATAGHAVPVAEVVAGLQRPQRAAGLHFVGGLDGSAPVELTRGPTTDAVTLAALDVWVRSWGKTSVVVADRPGRLGDRLLFAYLSEAVHLVAEGQPPEDIDRAVRRFGMERGPLETLDRLGFADVARRSEAVRRAHGDDFARNLALGRFRAFGWDGVATGDGFYRYRGDKAGPNTLARMALWQDVDDDARTHYTADPAAAVRDGLERLALRTVNDAAACLADEPDADPAAVDFVAVAAVGWAPHRGGPLQYADGLGLAFVVDRLTALAERFGRRFEPCVELVRRAAAGEPFFGHAEPEERRAAPRRVAGTRAGRIMAG